MSKNIIITVPVADVPTANALGAALDRGDDNYRVRLADTEGSEVVTHMGSAASGGEEFAAQISAFVADGTTPPDMPDTGALWQRMAVSISEEADQTRVDAFASHLAAHGLYRIEVEI